MSKKPPLYYWDADVFINLIQQTPEHYDILRSIIDQAKQGEVKIVTSFLTMAEVLKPNANSSRLPDQAEVLLDDLFENDYILLRTVDRNVGKKARDIRRYHGLKTADSIHVATALLYQATVLHTYDQGDLLPKNGKIGVPPLRIERPRGPVQKRIDFPEDQNPYAVEGDP